MWVLTISSSYEEKQVEVTSANFIIGRNINTAHIIVADKKVSGRHLQVFQQDDRWYVKDLGSTNGTYFRNNKVKDVIEWPYGESITIGNTTLQLKYIDEALPHVQVSEQPKEQPLIVQSTAKQNSSTLLRKILLGCGLFAALILVSIIVLGIRSWYVRNQLAKSNQTQSYDNDSSGAIDSDHGSQNQVEDEDSISYADVKELAPLIKVNEEIRQQAEETLSSYSTKLWLIEYKYPGDDKTLHAIYEDSTGRFFEIQLEWDPNLQMVNVADVSIYELGNDKTILLYLFGETDKNFKRPEKETPESKQNSKESEYDSSPSLIQNKED
ncbi:MAG: hypothetical protein A2Y62_04595 [Candidatus Fischerbacteria bacterium RBG_13_37_8]|uniref:FHA domain-containing protein n=1 Tax=Candidatus Fischerbacteria bacterium RBG_13_37_8 TaxID=1817863 RepID=A0A1F5VNT2_9BACT|nr:MAG: hypothetical protein A2Y62_04595 [Candidatus Fischerbacteria bacterium RBG_13_37_8]